MSASPPPREYYAHLGVDLAAPTPFRIVELAELMQNCVFLPSGSVANRPGFKFVATNDAGLGYVLYDRIEGGVEVKTRYAVGLTLKRVNTTGSVAITYSGSAVTVMVQVLADSDGHWYFQVVEDDTEKLKFDLGVGVDEGSPVTLANLETAIEAISADYAVVVTGPNTTPAALLPTRVTETLTGSPLTLSIPFEYTSTLRAPLSAPDPFLGHFNARNSASFRNATSVNIQQTLLIATEEDYLQKVDGVAVYRAGMPNGVITSLTGTGSAAFSGTYRYMFRYAFWDAKGNYVPGPLSDFKEIIVASVANVAVVIPYVQPSSGFMTDMAQVNGAQVGVNTITVDTGHGLQVGQKAAFLAGTTYAEVRNITAVTATTITVDGAVVTVADNAIISAGLLLEIYRTKDTGNITFLYAIASLPNNSSTSSITFSDATADAALGNLLVQPRRPYDPPPKGGVITLHQGLPIITRDPAQPNRVYYAEPTNVEGFPLATNNFDAFSLAGGPIMALWPNIAGLEIFYPSSQRRIIGSLADDALEIRDVSLAVGCASHHSLEQVDDAGRIVWISSRGPRYMYPGSYPQRFDRTIDPLFDENMPSDVVLRPERSLAVNMKTDKFCLFFLPAETTTGGHVHANDHSQVWILDYQQQGNDRWVGPWKNWNMAGGALYEEGELTFIERRYSDQASNMVYNIARKLNRHDEFDRVDHNVPIEMRWLPGWETGGTFTLKKIFEWLQLWSSDPQRVGMFTVDVTVEKDFRRGVPTARFSMTLGKGGAGQGWQFEPWGFFPWGMPESVYTEESIPDNGAFAMSISFAHEVLYEQCLITFFAMMVKSPYLIGKAR